MTLFYLKLIVTPLLMWAVSLAARRWGGLLGGLLSGLPITSALVMVFLCLEQGNGFVLAAVPGALAGLAAVQATNLCYLYATRRWSGAVSIGLSLVAYVTLASLLAQLGHLTLSIVVALLLVGVVLRATARERGPEALTRLRPRIWEIPLRMGAATALLVLTTGFAAWLGPAASGMLAPIPVIAWPLIVFSHLHGGRPSMASMIRGNAIGAVGVIFFYLSLAGTLAPLGIAAAFALAIGLAVFVTMGLARLLR